MAIDALGSKRIIPKQNIAQVVRQAVEVRTIIVVLQSSCWRTASMHLGHTPIFGVVLISWVRGSAYEIEWYPVSIWFVSVFQYLRDFHGWG